MASTNKRIKADHDYAISNENEDALPENLASPENFASPENLSLQENLSSPENLPKYLSLPENLPKNRSLPENLSLSSYDKVRQGRGQVRR